MLGRLVWFVLTLISAGYLTGSAFAGQPEHVRKGWGMLVLLLLIPILSPPPRK